MTRIAINGLGRIGRAVFKIALDHPELDLVAVNDLLSPENLAYLLRFDSVYGRYNKSVYLEDGALVVEDRRIALFSEKDPAELPWKDLGVDIAMECTGIFTNKEGLQKHLDAGARHAMLSAPAKGDGVEMIVPGVNHVHKKDRMFSTASCTTNCIAPVVEIMGRRIGVEQAIMTTVHAYTSSQELVDGPSKKFRRGRAAAINFVPTTTGAGKATGQVLPEFKDKFDGVAIRGPVAAGSIADIVFVTARPTTVEEINEIFREESQSDRYHEIVGVSDDDMVSADIIGDTHGSVVDLTMTKVVVGRLAKVMSWYDNEWGYAAQMVREAAYLADLWAPERAEHAAAVR
jgi:glyceraldehyde 3-phosphate dehydrogenase